MADKAKSNETSTGHHPFIIDPKTWVGTPWDGDGHGGFSGSGGKKSNAELVAELHARLAADDNVADLFQSEAFSSTKRASKLAGSGMAPVFPPEKTKKKLGAVPKATPSAQQQADEPAADANPFSEAIQAQRIPLEVVLPVAWLLPPGFSLRHLDTGVYLPLCAHGLRETADHLGVNLGQVRKHWFTKLLRFVEITPGAAPPLGRPAGLSGPPCGAWARGPRISTSKTRHLASSPGSFLCGSRLPRFRASLSCWTKVPRGVGSLGCL